MPGSARRAWEWPGLQQVLPDVVAFALGLSIAWGLHWRTTDLVWSLWLGSLVLGYVTILSTIAGGVWIGINVIWHKEFPREKRLVGVLIGTALALFFLGFFSLHFCGFHAGHAIFLSLFFPTQGLRSEAFFGAFMNPVMLWKTVIQHLVPAYGLFLVPAIIAERNYVFASFRESVREVREGMHGRRVQDPMGALRGEKGKRGDPFTRPYRNVVRMHLLIFFFAFCHFLKVESFVVFTVVYFVYFFPWKAFRKEAAGGELAPACSAGRDSTG